jgi:hypothetical protein
MMHWKFFRSCDAVHLTNGFRICEQFQQILLESAPASAKDARILNIEGSRIGEELSAIGFRTCEQIWPVGPDFVGNSLPR